MNKATDYIPIRIEQLKEDLAKASNAYDKTWYNRVIQELDWAHQMATTLSSNCYIERDLDKS
jgi:hypothetical protein